MSARERQEFAPLKTHIPLDSFGVPLALHVEIAENKKKVHEEMILGIKNLVDFYADGGSGLYTVFL